MDSKSAALFLAINLVLFVATSGSTTPCPPPPSSPSSKPSPRPSGPSPSGSTKTCPRDALKLGICANVLNGAVGAVIGNPPDVPCCSLLQGLVDLEVAVCLCTAIKANVLGINLNVPIALSLLVNTCGKKLPRDFQCA